MIRIDLHAHAFSAHTAPKVIVGLLALAHRTCPGFAPHGDGTVPDLLRAEAAAGFDRVAICNIATRPEHHAYMARFLTALSSGAMGEEAARRVIPCVSLHPHDPDAAAHIKALVDLGARMVKLHPYSQNVALDDPAMIRLMAVIRDAGLPILCHTGHDITAGEDDLAAPRRILRVLKAVPGLRLVCAHCAAWRHPETLDLLLGQPIGVDLAFQPATSPANIPWNTSTLAATGPGPPPRNTPHASPPGASLKTAWTPSSAPTPPTSSTSTDPGALAHHS